MIGPCFPRFYISHSANKQLPLMVVGRMGETRGSCATGYDRQTVVRSVGEALERQMSFSRMPPTCFHNRLDELEEGISFWFKSLFQAAAQSDLLDHRFSCVEATRLRDGKKIIIPAVPLTLAPHPDERFMPNRDSSGCAIHPDPDKALETAVCELAERQGLTLFWYFGHLNQATELRHEDIDVTNCAETMRILQWYNSNPSARVFLLDVSIIAPYRSVIAIYVNTKGPVYFAAGGSASRDASEAARKALIELYQAYVLTYQSLGCEMTESDFFENTDEVTKGYLSFNKLETAIEFTSLAEDRMIAPTQFWEHSQWLIDLKNVDILSYQQTLSFGRLCTSLTYVVTLCVPGFPLMSIEAQASNAELQAASNFGYKCQIRTGAVPFA